MENETVDIKEIFKNYFSSVIIDILKYSCIIVEETEDSENYCFFYQFYIDKKSKKVYFYYELDKLIKDNGVLYLNISVRLEKNLNKYEGFEIVVVNDCIEYSLSIFTGSYWKIKDKYCFINHITLTHKDIIKNIIRNWNYYDKIEDFQKWYVFRLNKKYQLIDNNSKIPEAFSEYGMAYKDFHKKELTPFSLDETVCVYMDK